MKTLSRVLLGLIALIAVILAVAYADGATLPVNHSVSVIGRITAPPGMVYGLITNVANGAAWRHEVKSVKMLAPEEGPNGREDHWVEDLGHGQTMTFLATKTIPEKRREVLLDVPGAAYGGKWTYELLPGQSPAETTVRITEDGFIHPPLYRFMMHHLFGMTRNLDQYMRDLQAEAAKS